MNWKEDPIINELKGNQEGKTEKENQEGKTEKELKENLGEKEESQGENLEDLKVTNHNCECFDHFY